MIVIACEVVAMRAMTLQAFTFKTMCLIEMKIQISRFHTPLPFPSSKRANQPHTTYIYLYPFSTSTTHTHTHTVTHPSNVRRSSSKGPKRQGEGI